MDTPSTPTVETINVQGKVPAAKSHLWASDHFSFHDLLDAINPLQHIPIVSTIYRAVTGDTLGNAARVVGDGIYGGVIGVIAGLVDVSVIEATGKDIGQNVMAALTGDDDAASGADPQAAQATSAPNAPAAAPPAASTAPTPKPVAAPAAADLATPVAAAGIPMAPAQAPLMPISAEPKLVALNGQARSFAIDTSPEGILALRTTSNSTPRPVALNIPGGTMASSQRVPVTGAEFAQRMQEGLDKYKALMLQRENGGTGSAINQVQ
ncbi:MAG TPA: hypothetical protein VGV37_12345 [Aliidongia sp.]|uniref:hypothetical protein n=1 Tax=Aliidongia sp. TaxID=1914230 RepID=UPI002DDDA776|nr:hypothetical protein [Aliidongia sp.]HEV2675324.1 hypothetical protein [Aliidongia sp.]